MNAVQAVLDDFVSEPHSVEELYAAHYMTSELANGVYGRYLQKHRDHWETAQAGLQANDETQPQAHDEVQLQAPEEVQHGGHSQDPSIEVIYTLASNNVVHVANSMQESLAPANETAELAEEPIVPDAVFKAEAGHPYNFSWMTKWNIPDHYLEGWRSKLKFEDLFRRGALKYNRDVLRFTSITNTGQQVERRFVANKIVPTPDARTGRQSLVITVLRDYPNTPDEAEFVGLCSGGKGIHEFVTQCFGDRSLGARVMNYSEISVTRDGVEVGTVQDIRIRYHLWEHQKDRYTARLGVKAGVKARVRRVLKTGKYSEHPGMAPDSESWEPGTRLAIDLVNPPRGPAPIIPEDEENLDPIASPAPRSQQQSLHPSNRRHLPPIANFQCNPPKRGRDAGKTSNWASALLAGVPNDIDIGYFHHSSSSDKPTPYFLLFILPKSSSFGDCRVDVDLFGEEPL
ncbi:MAG: hypothetical protein Q9218_001600 [Villophora microphyllina]